MVRILLVHDQVLLRESLCHLFSLERDLEVAGQCSAADEAIEQLKSKQVDVLVATWRLGPEFLAAARDQGGAERIVVLVDSMEPEDSVAAFHAGARAILSGESSSETLTRAVRLVGAGGSWMDQRSIDLLLAGLRRQAGEEGLSDRDQQILRGICDGLTNRRVAELVGVSENTVKAVLHRLYQKTRTAKRAQLVRRALQGEFGKFS